MLLLHCSKIWFDHKHTDLAGVLVGDLAEDLVAKGIMLCSKNRLYQISRSKTLCYYSKIIKLS
jgi:hypothetical protein